MRDLLPPFYLSLRAGGRAPLTLQWYQARLERFAAAMGGAPADAVTADQVREFMLTVARPDEGPPRSPVYVDSFRAALSALYSWAVSEERIARSPMRAVKRVRAQPRQIRTLTPEDVMRLIDAQPARTVLGVRNRAIIALLFDTGIRVGELVTLRLRDVDLAAGYALVRGKTGEGRVPLSIEMRRALLLYIQRARPRMFSFADPGVLFLGRRGTAMEPNVINQMLRRAGRAAGLTQTVGPHLFRHSFATEYLRNGGDPFTLQAILRHRTAMMTNRYVHVVLSDVEERHRTASPLARTGRRVV